MGPAFTGEMDKVVLTAGTTSGARASGSDFGAFIAPQVKGKQGAPELLVGAYDQFDGFGRGNGRGQVYRRVQNSGGLAGFEGAARLIGENACQADGFARQHIQSDAVAAHSCGV